MPDLNHVCVSRVRLFEIVSNDDGSGNEFGANKMVLT